MIAWAFDAIIGSTLLMLLVLAVRGPVARLFGADWAYALWFLPALRLVMPQLPSLSTPMSVPSITVVLPAVEKAAAVPLPVDAGPGQWVSLLLALWIGGAAAFLIWHQSAYSAFLLSIGSTPRKGDPESFGGVRVIESEAVDGPVAIGIFDKRIVVPPLFNWRYSPAEQRLALEHELIHHRRGDLWWNMGALIVLALNWFNPIAHFAFRAFRADQELACDAAIARKSPDRRHDYASALVKAASRPGLVAACPLNRADLLKRRLKLMKSHRASKARTLGGVAAVGLIAAGGLALSSPGFAQRDDDVGEVVVQAMERGGDIITPAEEAKIREICGESASGSNGISLRGRDGALVCENGKVVDDPEARAIVSRVTERARTKVETVMNDPAVVAAIDGEAARAAETAVAAIDEAEIANAVAEAETAVEAIDMSHVHEALAEAQASLAAIDMDQIAALSPAMASVMVDMPHVQLSAEDRAEIQASIAEARAEMAAVHIDRAEIAREMREAQIEIREAQRERHEALREAHRERAIALREAQRERGRALREAERERQQALREAERERERAQEAIERAREESQRD